MNDSQAGSAAAMLDTPSGPFVVAPAAGIAAPIKLSMIVPTYNESKNIAEMVRRLATLLDGALGQSYEIIVVDDNSPDRT